MASDISGITYFTFKFGLFFAAFIVVIAFLLYKFQNKLLYIPVIQGLPKSQDQNQLGMQNPQQIGLDYEDINIKTKDNINLHGWIAKRPNSKNVATVVYFHENAGNIGTRIFYMKEYNNQANVNVVLVAYRGYSNSEGEPSEDGLMIDAEAILTHVFSRTDIDTNKIFLHGRSLGGAVSIYSASTLKFPLAGVIVENTFTSISDMVDVIFSKVKFLKNLVLRNYWPSIDRIPKIKQPMLFIKSELDELVPPVQMQRLYQAATRVSFKKLHIIPDGDHNNSWTRDQTSYFDAVQNFIKECLQQ
ncbi:alpha/beta hydrolase family protein (macronuclear) [Tetrahymena thermophila SB210]|uniref:Alpha/beta hydrolase family protein n=1 Tax=Tetrahymena thermophila (strain SB210) TaxID=312017 RepID=Q23G43_TETTS|nr:alpha/beta hydrolase family protein [Tetrahymena thermophila SB210]EAR95417.2 alpha/beta hydrolase family protein [Tetrahymena thermophila SB210]|eukprot:XP_001015662.2 alpha/beta hydrolase family protein [Tetrahymena thermophila SB210]